MDDFASNAVGLDSPAYGGADLTPNDENDLNNVTRAVWVGTYGDIAVVLASGDSVTFKNVSGWMPLRVKRLMATGTTVSDIVGVW